MHTNQMRFEGSLVLPLERVNALYELAQHRVEKTLTLGEVAVATVELEQTGPSVPSVVLLDFTLGSTERFVFLSAAHRAEILARDL